MRSKPAWGAHRTLYTHARMGAPGEIALRDSPWHQPRQPLPSTEIALGTNCSACSHSACSHTLGPTHACTQQEKGGRRGSAEKHGQWTHTLHFGDGHVAELPLEHLLRAQPVALPCAHASRSACTLCGWYVMRACLSALSGAQLYVCVSCQHADGLDICSREGKHLDAVQMCCTDADT